MNKTQSPIFRYWHWWFTPRSNDPMLAYRERALRFFIPILILLRPLGIARNYSGEPDVPTPYAPFWVTIVFFVVPISFSCYFLLKQKINWSSVFFILHLYLIDLLSLPTEGYWYAGFQISIIIQIIFGTLLLPSHAILPFMLFQITTIGIWGNWLDVNYYDPPLLALGQPITTFQGTIRVLAVQEALIMYIIRYLRIQMEYFILLQQDSITKLQDEMEVHKQVELALQSSKDLYHRAINAAGAVPYSITFKEHGYKFNYVSENIFQMTGYSASEMNAVLWKSLIQEGFPRGKLAHLTYEEADRITDEDHSILWECDFRIHTRDGKTRWISDTSVKGLDEKGENIISIGIYQDITERKQTEEMLYKAYDSTLQGWARALEFRDKETEGHSRRVVEITLKLAQALGIDNEDELINIRRGAILHDIGKLSIPDEILLKQGKLTEGERQIISQHPWIGYKLLAPIDFLKGSLDVVRYHHEKWDGSGYLSGSKGEEIPLAARIFGVVDVWDAVQAERPYKKAWTRKKAIQHLQAEAGKQFDPRIVTLFLELVE